MKLNLLSSRHAPVYRILSLVAVLAVLITGCGLGKPAEPTATPTSAATDTPTATNTPEPTNTPTSTSTPTPDRTKIAAATATQQAADDLAKIQPELEKLGFTTDQGKLAWVSSEPIELISDEHLETIYAVVSEEWVKDFVLQTEVTWDSTSGLAGCAINFREQPDLNDDSFMTFPLMRLQSAPAFDIEFIEYHRSINLYQNVIFDTNIKDMPGDTNVLALVVKGNEITPYINGKTYRTVKNNKLTEGMISFTSWQESGETTCIFDNGWLFELD